MTKQTYLTFLLRLWRVDGGGQDAWRASLEDAHSGERRGFSDLPELHGFLQALVEAHPQVLAGRTFGDLREAAQPPAAEA
jgi:hypothetical protein